MFRSVIVLIVGVTVAVGCRREPEPAHSTADARVVDRLAAAFGVNVIREQDHTITHNLRTAVIDPHGRIVSIHDSNDWTAATIADELETALHAR